MFSLFPIHAEVTVCYIFWFISFPFYFSSEYIIPSLMNQHYFKVCLINFYFFNFEFLSVPWDKSAASVFLYILCLWQLVLLSDMMNIYFFSLWVCTLKIGKIFILVIIFINSILSHDLVVMIGSFFSVFGNCFLAMLIIKKSFIFHL